MEEVAVQLRKSRFRYGNALTEFKSGHGARVWVLRGIEESAVVRGEQTGAPFNRNWNRRGLTIVRVQALLFYNYYSSRVSLSLYIKK